MAKKNHDLFMTGQMPKSRSTKQVGTGTRNDDTWVAIGPNDGKRPAAPFFKKMKSSDRGKGTWGGSVSRP